MRKTSDIIKLVSLLLVSIVVLTACGGGASTEGNQDTTSNTSGSLITSNTSAEVVAYEKNVWQNLSSQSRCGRCHSTGGQDPQFVHAGNITTAHAAVVPFVVLSQDSTEVNNSRLVDIIRNGHKLVNGKSQGCWLATDALCADAIRDYIIAWDKETAVDGGAAVPTGVKLVAPPIRGVEESKSFPDSSSNFASLIHTPLLTKHCSGCHTPTSLTPRSPFFATNDVDSSYLEAQQKIDLLTPANSRFVLKISGEVHNCWTDDCDADALTMQNAITAFANTITPTQVDPNLIISKALKLQPPEAIIAAGGERHALNQIALWEFKNVGGDPTSTKAYDTSGVAPEMNLTLSGDYSWVGGYGVQFRNGRAKATVESSKKLINNLRTRGEYSVEAWIIPANVVQQDRNIISYSGGATQRNFTIAQNEYNYQFYNRMTFPSPAVTDLNGGPLLESDANEEFLQASQQHIVMNYDPVNGRRMFVNGVELTGANNTDANDVGGKLTDWSDIFAFTLANESGVSNPWQGTFRLVAIHNRVLTKEQIEQNFKAGVGEKFFLLFSIGHIPGVPADSYIKVQAEQFDTYSYLFNNPVYVNLGDPTPTIDFDIGGMRIGINGKEAIVGQSFINLNVDRITTNNQEVSRLGSVIQLQKGTQVDDFFLSFEKLGSKVNTFVVAAPPTPVAPPDLPAQSDIGVRTFSEINGTMSDLTGVPTSNSSVLGKYKLLKQQMPSSEDINAFGPANIIAISQLAFEYCDQLVENTPNIPTLCERTGTTISARECMFSTFDTNGDFDKAAATAFDSAGKTLVANALYDRMIGIPTGGGATLNNAPTREEITNELINAIAADPYPGNLVDRLLTESCVTSDLNCGTGESGTKEITKAMCTSVLSSAAMLLQ